MRNETLSKYLKLWSLSSPEKIAETETGSVFKVQRSDQFFVLKILSPEGKLYEANAAMALRYFDGSGSVRVIQDDKSALLLESLDGCKLSTISKRGEDELAANVICETTKKLHSKVGPLPKAFLGLDHRFSSLFARVKLSGQDALIYEASQIAEKLIKSQTEQKVLHGDIHHSNIIHSSRRGWLAIDPQPLVGERAYDLANSFYNPDDQPELVETKERILRLAKIYSEKLKLDRKRLLQFAYAHGGLSVSWLLDEAKDPSRRLRIMLLMRELL